MNNILIKDKFLIFSSSRRSNLVLKNLDKKFIIKSQIIKIHFYLITELKLNFL